MPFDFLFFINAVAFGFGLAADAFSVSLANGLNEPDMKRRRMLAIAGTFGLFQFVMPMIGWFCVHAVASAFAAFQKFIPWIALILLVFIGGKMLLEGIRGQAEEPGEASVGAIALFVQGVATSIDALSVGFTIADYTTRMALIESAIIGIVTFGVCMAGLCIGRKFGTKLAGKASILGGVILILIGLEIFIKGLIG